MAERDGSGMASPYGYSWEAERRARELTQLAEELESLATALKEGRGFAASDLARLIDALRELSSE